MSTETKLQSRRVKGNKALSATVVLLLSGGALVGCAQNNSPAKNPVSQPPTQQHTSKPASPKPSPSPTTSKSTAQINYPASAKVIYLTFDDGPGIYTPKVLDILKRKQVPATFFEIGQNVSRYPQYSKLLISSGMSVQMHSWKHDFYTKLSNQQIVKDIAHTRGEIQSVTGVSPTCIRPPYGATNSRVHAAIAATGTKSVLWSADSMDWSRPGIKTIVHNILKETKPNGILLFHDGGGNRSETLQALPIVIDSLKKQGYHFKLICS